MPTNFSLPSLLAYIKTEEVKYRQELLTYLKKHDITSLILNAFSKIDGKVVYFNINNRRIGSIILQEPMQFSEEIQTKFIELMEPKPEKVGKDFVGFEHTEIYVPEFNQFEIHAKEKHLPYELYANEAHTALVCKISEAVLRLKSRSFSFAVAYCAFGLGYTFE